MAPKENKAPETPQKNAHHSQKKKEREKAALKKVRKTKLFCEKRKKISGRKSFLSNGNQCSWFVFVFVQTVLNKTKDYDAFLLNISVIFSIIYIKNEYDL